MRRQQEEEREAIRNALLEMKKEERDEVRRMRDKNMKRIEEIKSKNLNLNKERHDRVKLIESSSK